MAAKSDDTLVCSGEAQKSASDDQVQNEKNSHPGPPCPSHSPHRLCATVDTLPVVKRGRANFAPAKQTRLKNSLLGVVGFLELANAGDFAANVWNEVPVPTHAVVLMAVGGTFALLMSVFAFRDALLSWPNVCLLREQRRRLRRERAERLKEEDGSRKQQQTQTHDLDVLLDVTWRELGTEAINRFGLDLLLGSGAVMIGVGTLMAIGGADRRVWFASNLLSGYVGNTPLALYALVNCAWACYVCTRAGQHRAAAAASLRGKQKTGEQDHHPAWAAVRRRARNVRLFAVITSVASILGGAGSMMTATMWYGYIILIPVIISSVLCNFWWRYGLGYDRPLFSDEAQDSMSAASLMLEMEYVARAQDAFRRDPATAAGELHADLESLESVLGFIVANDLFEDFCLRLLRDRELASVLFPVERASFDIEAAGLLEMARGQHADRVLGAAKKCVREDGLRRFQSRERYLAESLMTCLYMSHSGA